MTDRETKEKRILMTVKTYPTPSKNYVETVCTAGITEEGNWIRLYPVKFRHLSENQKFGVFTWITAQVTKTDGRDKRPESYRIETDSICIDRKLDPQKDIEEKLRYLRPLIKYSVDEIDLEYQKDMTSLALLKPKCMDDFIIERHETPDWTDEELTKLNQMDLFAKEDDRKALKKVPYRFFAYFHCHDKNCPGHRKMITAWDFNWSYFIYRLNYSTENIALQNLKEAWMKKFTEDKDGYLFLGTTHPYPSFITIGYFSYPLSYIKESNNHIFEQMSLFV